MAAKKKKSEGQRYVAPRKSVTYVARAGMWCETIIDEKGQRQTWHEKKPV